jgi:hypothetical protein
MKVAEIAIETLDECVQLSAMVDDFPLWYQFPLGTELSRRGDCLLAASLLPAMVVGSSLEIDHVAPVSARLLENCEVIQDVFRCWYPDLHRVKIECTVESPRDSSGEVGSFFSGGVDGTYTFLKHDVEITKLLFIRGIDMQLGNQETFHDALKYNQWFAEKHGKCLMPIVSNVRFLFHHFGSRGWNTLGNGAGLASVALALNLTRTYIASSHAYDQLSPLGSHPLVDGLFSTEVNEIVHDGAEATRGDKLLRIAQEPDAMGILRVCWHDKGYNCNECEKCMRTRIGLRALGLTSPMLKPLDSLSEVRRFRVHGEGKLTFMRENLSLAKAGGDTELARALEVCLWRHEARKTLSEIDRVLLGSAARKLFQVFRGRNK